MSSYYPIFKGPQLFLIQFSGILPGPNLVLSMKQINDVFVTICITTLKQDLKVTVGTANLEEFTCDPRTDLQIGDLFKVATLRTFVWLECGKVATWGYFLEMPTFLVRNKRGCGHRAKSTGLNFHLRNISLSESLLFRACFPIKIPTSPVAYAGESN